MTKQQGIKHLLNTFVELYFLIHTFYFGTLRIFVTSGFSKLFSADRRAWGQTLKDKLCTPLILTSDTFDIWLIIFPLLLFHQNIGHYPPNRVTMKLDKNLKTSPQKTIGSVRVSEWKQFQSKNNCKIGNNCKSKNN